MEPLDKYRAEIRKVWLLVVRRSKLTSHEQKLIKQWHSETPLAVVLQAIADVSERARSKNLPLYSLGVIRADLERLKIQQAKSQVGAQQVRDWLARYTEDLTDLVSLTDNPDERDAYKALLNELPSLTEADTHKRWQEIERKFNK